MTWFHEQFGDTNKFALALKFLDDPHPSVPTPGALWGTFELWTCGKCLTRSQRDDGSIASGVEWYLEPLVTWLHNAAVRMLNEEPFPGNPFSESIAGASEWYRWAEEPPVLLTNSEEDAWYEQRDEWRSCHSLRTGFPGAAVPAVFLRRFGDAIEVSWDNETWPASRGDLQFLEPQGVRFVRAEVVGQAVRALLKTVRERLANSDFKIHLPPVPSTPREDDWCWLVPKAAATAVKSTATFEALRKKLSQNACESTWPVVGSTIETLLLRAHLPSDAESLEQLLRLADEEARPTQPSEVVESIRNPSPPPTRMPWRAGYEEALRVREVLGWDGSPAPPLDTWLKGGGCGVSDCVLNEVVDGATVVSENGSVLLHVNPRGRGTVRWSRQMIFGTSLGHAVMDAPLQTDFASIQTPWADWRSAARARAFAAMLLMPSDAVKETLSQFEVVSPEAVMGVMQRFGTGLTATTWHLRNLSIISDDERADLLHRVPNSTRQGIVSPN